MIQNRNAVAVHPPPAVGAQLARTPRLARRHGQITPPELSPARRSKTSADHPDWLHGHGTQWRKAFVYVPRGCDGFHAIAAEYDVPRERVVTVKAPDVRAAPGCRI
jgi:hypothetical protein